MRLRENDFTVKRYVEIGNKPINEDVINNYKK